MEKGTDDATGQVLVEVDPRYFRPTEVHHLQGDASKACRQLGWKPRIGFRQLVREVVRYDVNTMRLGLAGGVLTEAES